MIGSVSLVLDRQRRLLTYVARGFLEEDEVSRLVESKDELLRSLGGDLNDHVTLADVSACQIQSQTVAVRLTAMIGDRRSLPRRMAFVTGPGSLVRMQLRRMIQGAETAQMFIDRDAAEAWLFSPEPQGA